MSSDATGKPMSTEGPFIVDGCPGPPHEDNKAFVARALWSDIACAVRHCEHDADQDAAALNAAWRLGRERGRQEAAPRWIPCSERMPEKGTRVLATLLTGEMTTLAWWPDTGFWAPGAIGPGPIYRQHKVTHWMPLPEPPKQGEKP